MSRKQSSELSHYGNKARGSSPQALPILMHHRAHKSSPSRSPIATTRTSIQPQLAHVCPIPGERAAGERPAGSDCPAGAQSHRGGRHLFFLAQVRADCISAPRAEAIFSPLPSPRPRRPLKRISHIELCSHSRRRAGAPLNWQESARSVAFLSRGQWVSVTRALARG